jgi:hypothetical protein
MILILALRTILPSITIQPAIEPTLDFEYL